MSVVEVAPSLEPRATDAGRYDAFLSYAREDSTFVANLREQLHAREHEVWIDVDILGGAKWRDRVRRGIEACKALIFIISPDSIASEACRQELEDAVLLNKLIVPVFYREVSEPLLPRSLADAEWVFLRDGDDRALGINRLIDALETDLEWRDQHTRLAGRAREWLDADRDHSYLLRGADLREAERWLTRQGGHRQAPTREHAEYIARSRQAASRRLSVLIGGLVLGMAITSALAAFALIQRHTAISQTHAAQSELLAAEATRTQNVALALEAYRLSPTVDARSAVFLAAANHQLGVLSADPAIVHSVAFSPDGKTLAAGYDDSKVTLSAVRNRHELPVRLKGLGGSIQTVAFSPDGRTVAAGGSDRKIWLWDPATGLARDTSLTGHSDWVTSLAFSPDGKILASGSEDDTIRLWDLGAGRQLGAPLTGDMNRGGRRVAEPFGWVKSVAFSPDGKTLASGSADSTITVWDIATHRQSGGPLTGHTRSVNSVAFSPNGKILASGGADGTIRLWDVAAHRQLGVALIGHGGAVNSVAFSPDGELVASGGDDGTIRLWDVATHQELGEPFIGLTGSVNSVAFAPDGETLAAGGEDGTTRLWKVADPRQLGIPFTDPSGVVRMALSPDGKILASGSTLGTITLWDTTTHRRVGSPRRSHTALITSLAFSPDGKLLASTSEDYTIRLWDVATHRELGGRRTRARE
jgi:WD40 repeat protein